MRGHRFHGRYDGVRWRYSPCGISQFSKKGRWAFKFGIPGYPTESADVYDNSAITRNRDRIPGSRARGKISIEKKKEQDGKVKGQEIGPDGENHRESDNHHVQVEVGNEGEDDYNDNWEDRTSDVRYTGGPIDSPIDLDWGRNRKPWGR